MCVHVFIAGGLAMLQFAVALSTAAGAAFSCTRHLRKSVTGGLLLLLAAPLPTIAQSDTRPSVNESQGMHGHGHDKLHHWYDTLTQPDSGYSCCNDKDCRPTTARRHGEILEVLVDGEWMEVPSKAILERTSPDMHTHVCAAQLYGRPKVIFCVVLGFGT